MINLKRENIIACFFLLLSCSISLSQDLNNVNIGIVHSELTKQLLYKLDNSFYPVLDWELFFLNEKLSYSVIEDCDLDSYNLNDLDVLILPSVEILTEQSIENLKEFLSVGKNIFVLGNLGSFDPQLKTRDPEALEILTGINTAELPVENKISENISLFNSNFLNQDLNGDFEFLIVNRFTPLYAKERPLKTNLLGSYLLNDYKEGDISSFIGAAAIENEKGKVLWFGFQLSQISLSEENRQFLNQIILNGINWLAGNPLVWVNSFPEFYTSATIFSSWVENINSTLNKTVPIFKEESVPLNFFISPLEVKKTFEEIYKLSSAGSVNLLFDEFDYLYSDSSQTELIFEETSKLLRGGSRQEYFGIQNLNSSETYVNKSNLKNYFDFLLDPTLKFYYLKSDEEFNSLQGITYNYVDNPVDLIESTIKNDLQKVNDLYENLSKTRGIVSHIIKNSSIYFNSSVEEKLKLIINFAKANNSFITTYSELINWFKTKKNIKVDAIVIKDESKITVKVKNIGNIIAEQIGLNISIPSNYKTLLLIGYNFNLNYSDETGYYNLIIPFLHSGQTLTFDIKYRK